MQNENKSVGPKQLTQEQIDKTLGEIKQAMAQPMPNTDILDLTKEMQITQQSQSQDPNYESVDKHAHKDTYDSVKQLLDVVDITKSSCKSKNTQITLEDFMTPLIKPHIKQWMDENLPELVERIVQKEIKKLIEDQK